MAKAYKFNPNGTFIYKCEDDVFENGSSLSVAANQYAVFVVNGKAEAVFTQGEYIFGTDIELTEGSLYIVDSSVTMAADWQTDGAVKHGDSNVTLSGEMTVAVNDAKLLCENVESKGLEALFTSILENDLMTIAKESLDTDDFAAYIKEKLSLSFEKVGATLYSLTANKQLLQKAKKQVNTKKILISVVSTVAAVAIVALVAVKLVIPSIRYNGAVKAIEQGDYLSAYETLTSLKGFSDSEQRLAEIEAPVTKEKLKTADEKTHITFGSYEQDGDLSNGAEPIEWLIVKKEDDKVLLTTKYALEARPLNVNNGPCKWESCSMRTWLGNEFMNKAFTEAQQALICETKNKNVVDSTDAGIKAAYTTTDKVFLFDSADAYDFLEWEERQVIATPYAVQTGAYTDEATGLCWWWTRSPGMSNEMFLFSDLEGLINDEGDGVANKLICARPVIYLSIA